MRGDPSKCRRYDQQTPISDDGDETAGFGSCNSFAFSGETEYCRDDRRESKSHNNVAAKRCCRTRGRKYERHSAKNNQRANRQQAKIPHAFSKFVSEESNDENGS